MVLYFKSLTRRDWAVLLFSLALMMGMSHFAFAQGSGERTPGSMEDARRSEEAWKEKEKELDRIAAERARTAPVGKDAQRKATAPLQATSRSSFPRENVADLAGASVDISEVTFSDVDVEVGLALLFEVIDRYDGVAVKDPNAQLRMKGSITAPQTKVTREGGTVETQVIGLATEVITGIFRAKTGVDTQARVDQERTEVEARAALTIEDRNGTTKYRVKCFKYDEPVSRYHLDLGLQFRAGGRLSSFLGRDSVDVFRDMYKTANGMANKAAEKMMAGAVITPSPVLSQTAGSTFTIMRYREGGRLWLVMPAGMRPRLKVGQQVSVLKPIVIDGRAYKGDRVASATITEIVQESVQEISVSLTLDSERSLGTGEYSILIP